MKKNHYCIATSVITVLLLLTSCATIVGKSSYPVSINSIPSGATVVITNKKGKEVYKGTSPATVSLKSGAGYFAKAHYEVKITSRGYEEQNIPVNFRFNGWYIGNILFGGIIGLLIVDPATGAMWKLATQPINVTLSKSTALIEYPELKIIDIANVSQNMKEHLVKVK